MDQRDDSNQEFFRRLFSLAVLKPLRELQEYVSLYAQIDDPEGLVLKIRRDQLGAIQLSKAIAISMLVAGILAELLKVEIGKLEFGVPLLDPILAGLLLVVGYVFAAVLLHWPLRLFGGQASFRHTFIANTFVSATTYPLLVLAVGGMTYFGMDENRAWSIAGMSPMGLLVAVLGPVHGISRRRAGVVLAVSLVSYMVLGAVAVIMYLNS